MEFVAIFWSIHFGTNLCHWILVCFNVREDQILDSIVNLPILQLNELLLCFLTLGRHSCTLVEVLIGL